MSRQSRRNKRRRQKKAKQKRDFVKNYVNYYIMNIAPAASQPGWIWNRTDDLMEAMKKGVELPIVDDDPAIRAFGEIVLEYPTLKQLKKAFPTSTPDRVPLTVTLDSTADQYKIWSDIATDYTTYSVLVDTTYSVLVDNITYD